MPNSRDESRKIRVVIVDDIAETRDNIRKLLYFEDDIEIVGAAANGREGIELVIKLQPDIALMDINMPETDGIAASEAITSQAPSVQVVMMSVQGEADYLRRSMLAGAREFLIKPFTSEELTTSIRRVYQLASARRAYAPPVAPPTLEQASTTSKKPAGAKVVAIYSPKGGTGVTTIAVNLAVALHDETQQRVALVDASLQFGDVGLLMNLPTHRSIADVVDSKSELDEELLLGVMAGHSSGVKVLLAPPRPELAELITTEIMKSVLRVISNSFDYIVIDTDNAVNDMLLAILDQTDQIVLVATSDLASLKNSKLFFDVTEALNYPPEKTHLVLSKEEGRGISLNDIQGNLKQKVAGLIPREDKVANAALNRGVPFVIGQRALPISQSVFQLARLVKTVIPEPTRVEVSTMPTRASTPEKFQKRGIFSLGKR